MNVRMVLQGLTPGMEHRAPEKQTPAQALTGLFTVDLLRTIVRWDHWASGFCRTASNRTRSTKWRGDLGHSDFHNCSAKEAGSDVPPGPQLLKTKQA
jgi:hypothetical protein